MLDITVIVTLYTVRPPGFSQEALLATLWYLYSILLQYLLQDMSSNSHVSQNNIFLNLFSLDFFGFRTAENRQESFGQEWDWSGPSTQVRPHVPTWSICADNNVQQNIEKRDVLQ